VSVYIARFFKVLRPADEMNEKGREIMMATHVYDTQKGEKLP
jgi:hypothetical protein